MGLTETYQAICELTITLIDKHTVDVCTGEFLVNNLYLQIESSICTDCHLVLQVNLSEQFHTSVKPAVRTKFWFRWILKIDLPHIIVVGIAACKTHTSRELVYLHLHLHGVTLFLNSRRFGGIEYLILHKEDRLFGRKFQSDHGVTAFMTYLCRFALARTRVEQSAG